MGDEIEVEAAEDFGVGDFDSFGVEEGVGQGGHFREVFGFGRERFVDSESDEFEFSVILGVL